MKIATWNVNSLAVRLPHVLDWLAAQPVDVLALQELKLTDDRFPAAALAEAGYQAQWFGQKTYNGVALLSRSALGNVVRNIPGFADDSARVIAATVQPSGASHHGGQAASAAAEQAQALRIVNGYFVNGQAPGSDKFAYKMAWLTALRDWLRRERAAHPHLVLLGDFNIAPQDIDSHDPDGLRETIHHTTEERAHFQALLQLGLHDAFRLFEQPPKSFSWWDYRMLGFQKNRGLRIDHILVSDALAPKVTACTIDRAPRKLEKPSDHAPVVVELAL